MHPNCNKTVTLDTCTLPPDDLLRAGEGLNLDFKVVTVTSRETEDTDKIVTLRTICESAVWGESHWDECVFADEPVEASSPNGSRLSENKDRLEAILGIISNRSFPPPGKRESLSDGQVSQLRDAMIFDSHVRESRDIFVTLDRRAFLGPRNAPNSIRKALEEGFNTLIMTPDEFMTYCTNWKAKAQ